MSGNRAKPPSAHPPYRDGRRRGWARRVLPPLFALAAASAWGLPEDSAAEIRISAAESTYDATTGLAVLTGAVRLTQGSLRIDASRVTTATENGRLSQVVAEGDADAPATMRQRIEPDEPFVTASAARIEYAITEERLRLEGDAVLKQGTREISADVILWHIQEGRVTARSERPGGVTSAWRPEREPAAE